MIDVDSEFKVVERPVRTWKLKYIVAEVEPSDATKPWAEDKWGLGGGGVRKRFEVL